MPSFPKRDALMEALDALRPTLGDEAVDALQKQTAEACDEAYNTAFNALSADDVA